MIAVSFRFLAGRYHATPWGRHVNEGAVEWPPSPWRILRAVVASWKRTLPELPQEHVEPMLRALTAAPGFVLPAASTGHSRHYMPWFKKGPGDHTLVFDCFVAVPRGAMLVVLWPDASLDDRQRRMLARILANLNTLGRSESWCDAALVANDDAATLQRQGHFSSPLNGRAPPAECEIVRLLCADPVRAFDDDHVVRVALETEGRGSNQRTIERRSTCYDPAWNLCIETLQLHEERWSDPPGSRWVPYARPRDCFKIDPIARSRVPARPQRRIEVARYALDSTVLPLITETLPVAEAARRALMSIHGRLTEHDGVRGRSSVLSGKDARGVPLQGHHHAHYLPTDEDRDGRIDHLTVFARDAFGRDESGALDRLQELDAPGGREQRHPLRLLLLGIGPLDEYAPGPLRPSKIWTSATPFVPTRHCKWRGSPRRLVDGPEEQLILECRRRGLPEPEAVERLPDHRRGGHMTRWIAFRRWRRNGAAAPGAYGFRIRFGGLVTGPVALGFAAHYGLGLFVPDE